MRLVSIAAVSLLSIGMMESGLARHIGRHASKHASAKPHRLRLAALTPFMPKPAVPNKSAAACDTATFRIVLDVGHTAQSEGAISARNVAEFDFNLRLARRIAERLKADGFAATRLLVTQGRSTPGLFRRVAVANDLQADLFLSIHHDSVPNALLENWDFEGRKSHFSDRFGGYSVFVSRENPEFGISLKFAELIGREMKAQGLDYARQYTMPIMGRYRHELLDEETGVYRYDELVVLRKTRMPAVLLEAGSIINRDEELKMSSPEHQDIIASGVTTAVKEFCDPRWAILGPL
jgi:N-acetylmuramoyl-L-alanine amidase